MLLESGIGDGRYPTVEAIFAPTAVPGLLAGPDRETKRIGAR
jgi:hypothetical protein